MSQLQSYRANGNTWVDVTLDGVEAPIATWDGTRWVDLDLGGIVDPNPDPVAAFDTLPDLTMFLDAADPLNTGTAPADKSVRRTWVAKNGGQTFNSPVFAGETEEQTDLRAPKYYAATSTEPAHMRFSGGNRLFTDSSSLPASGGMTVYVVARAHHLGYGCIFSSGNQTASQSNPAVVMDCGADGRTRGLRRTNDGALALTAQPLIANAWRVFSLSSADYKNVAFRANENLSAGSATATSTGVATMNRMAIGARVSPNGTDSFGNLWAGDVAAVVTYAAQHDTRTRQAVEQQIATRYKVVLPSQGGVVDGDPARITAHRLQLSREYGIPATQRVTGATLPGFHNTGPAVTVKSTDFEYIEGSFSTTSQDQVVSKKWINGGIIVRHAGVKFEDCVLFSTIDPKLDTRNQPTISGVANVDINRCEVFGKENDSSTGIGYIRYTVRNSFLHDSEDNTRLNKDTVIDNNLMAIHSNGFLTQTERLHTDCVQSNGGDNDPGVRSYVRNNTLIAFRHNLTKGNSAVILATEGAFQNGANQGSPLRRVTVEGNYLAGGSFSLYIKTMGTAGSPGPMEDIVIRNNEFRGNKPTTPVTMRSGISTADLPEGAFVPSQNGFGDAWLPYASLADTFLTMDGNIRENGQPLTIVRSVQGQADSNA